MKESPGLLLLLLRWLSLLTFEDICCAARGNEEPFVTASAPDLNTYHSFSTPESSNLGTLTLSSDTQTLYIGAKDRVFGRNLVDITKEKFPAVVWPVIKKESCSTLPQSLKGENCYNLVQIVQPLNKTHVLICGTNSLEPENKLLVRENEGQQFSLEKDSILRNPLCSGDPNDSVTSLMTPRGDIFSTPRAEIFSKISFVKSMANSILMTNTKMDGEKVTIVSSFTADDTAMSPTMSKVYFVSDEQPTESSSPAPTVTQVCANDIGGKNILTNTWTSLLKVRLACLTEDEYPLRFDLITDLVTGKDRIIYGTFTTRHDTSRTNAVCAFRLSEIQKAFNEAQFLESGSSVPAPSMRPGMCAYPGMLPDNPSASTSKDFPASHLQFMSSHSLIDGIVKPSYPLYKGEKSTTWRKPLFIKFGEKFTKIAVEQVKSLDDTVFDIVFVAREDGIIHKFVAIEKNFDIETIELSQYTPPSNDPVISMKLSQELGQLYVGTDRGVYQVATTNCAVYTKSCKFCDPCRMCILSRDPSCAWDNSTKECVAIKGKDKSNLLQDIIHGDGGTQCGTLETPEPILRKVEERILLGEIVENPIVSYTWYKDKGVSTKEKIKDESGKYRITKDGQLQISNFDASTDSAKYECEYSVKSSIVKVVVYDVKSSTYIPPVVSVAARTTPTDGTIKRNATNGNTGGGVTQEPETTSAEAIAMGQTSLIFIIIGVLVVLIIVFAAFLLFRCKTGSKKYPTNEDPEGKQQITPDGNVSPINEENTTNNNNARHVRLQSEFDDRANRPLLSSNQATPPEDSDPESNSAELPTASQRNAKSLDFLNVRDTIDYIDDDNEDAVSDKIPSREQSGSMRESTGRKRVPPARTKSMPGSELYVVFGGKKLKCSTLQRNKQGAWTIEVKPNQSGMAVAPDMDEIIDIFDDSEIADIETFHPTNENLSAVKTLKESLEAQSTSSLKNAENRRAFFEADSGKPSADKMPHVRYMTSTPNSNHIAAKSRTPSPFTGKKEPSTEQSSQASLRSFSQNSSEDRDSDCTVKGSSMTLQPDDPLLLFPNEIGIGPHKHRHHHTTLEAATEVPTSDVTPSKKRKNKPSKPRKEPLIPDTASFHGSNKSLDRSSGSSDGDDPLHGRVKSVTRKSRSNKPLDSPSKESRTSQGSSSSSEYKSARSSVVSEPFDHR